MPRHGVLFHAVGGGGQPAGGQEQILGGARAGEGEEGAARPQPVYIGVAVAARQFCQGGDVQAAAAHGGHVNWKRKKDNSVVVEVPNSQRLSCLDSFLGRVPACDAASKQ